VVLLVHGRSPNVSTRASIAARLRDDGFGVLLFDYRGYGRSSGRPTEESLTADAEAAYDWLRGQDVSPGRIIVLGQSLGDAPAAQLTASRPVAGLALVSPFTSLPDAIADRTGVGIIRQLPWPRNRFEVADSLVRTRAPVLFIVSRQDGLVPYANSYRASQHARFGRWLEAGGLGHDGLLAAVARDGRLSQALRELVPPER
jgi:pimeloyl-ACP methyl ester carboxylesterase